MTHHEIENAPEVNFKPSSGIGLLLALIGGGGLFAMVSGTDGLKNVATGYFFGWALIMSLCLGCLGFTMLHHTVRGSWGLAVLRIFEAGSSPTTLFIMLLGYLPIWMNREVIYHHWIHYDPADQIMLNKLWWLNEQGFMIRTLVYFAIWIAISALLRKWSIKEDETKDIRFRQKRTNLSAIGLVIYVLSITLAATDWFMSVDPHWFSAIFGPLYMIGGAVFAISFATLIVCKNAKKAPYTTVMSKNLTKDLGNLMFCFTMLWIYFTLSQYIIIWSGNLPEFITFYKNRQGPFLSLLGTINILFTWLLPWGLLLAPINKAKPERLMIIALIAVVMRSVDVYWNFMPFFRATPNITDLFGVMAVLGIWMFGFGQSIRKASLLPSHDTRLQEALKHQHA